MGDARGAHGFDEAEPNVGGQVVEEGASAAKQDRNLVDDHLVDQPRGDRRGERDAGTFDGCLYRVGEGLPVGASGLPPSKASESS